MSKLRGKLAGKLSRRLMASFVVYFYLPICFMFVFQFILLVSVKITIVWLIVIFTARKVQMVVVFASRYFCLHELCASSLDILYLTSVKAIDLHLSLHPVYLACFIGQAFMEYVRKQYRTLRCKWDLSKHGSSLDVWT